MAKRKDLTLRNLKHFLPEFVYGGIDGSITTFAVVAGASGANLGTGVVIILGFANLIADGFSMSVGNYLSTKAEVQEYEKHRQREYWEIEHLRNEEIEEIREIYRKKGFEGKLLEEVVAVITADKDRWVDTMMKEELEMLPNSKPPLHTAIATFIAFVVVGLIPLLTYLFNVLGHMPEEKLFPYACLLTSGAFILIGYLKSMINEISKIKGILETLALGGVAAGISYFVGDLLESLLR